jgi:hypothetical protein
MTDHFVLSILLADYYFGIYLSPPGEGSLLLYLSFVIIATGEF